MATRKPKALADPTTGGSLPEREGKDAKDGYLLRLAARALRAWVAADLAESVGSMKVNCSLARQLTGQCSQKGLFRRAGK